MSVLSGQALTVEFVTAHPDTGEALDADATPTAVLAKNGTDTAQSCTVTNKSTGRYKVAVTLPALVEGDSVSLTVSATVFGIDAVGIIFQDTCGAAADIDSILGIAEILLAWRENKLIRDDSVPGVVTWTLRNVADDDDYRTQDWHEATGTRDAAEEA